MRYVVTAEANSLFTYGGPIDWYSSQTKAQPLALTMGESTPHR